MAPRRAAVVSGAGCWLPSHRENEMVVVTMWSLIDGTTVWKNDSSVELIAEKYLISGPPASTRSSTPDNVDDVRDQ